MRPSPARAPYRRPITGVVLIAAATLSVVAGAEPANEARRAAAGSALGVGTARSAPGKVTRGALAIGERPDGAPIALPVVIVSGKKPGPVVWIDALAHGDEYGGARALHEVLKRLDPGTMAGQVVALLASNPAAFEGLQRTNPGLDDLTDIGGVFPGDRDGFLTERLAAAISDKVKAQADYFIDLHTGGDRFKQHPFILYTPNSGLPEARYDELARAFGIPTLWRDGAGTFKRDGIMLFSSAGIPSFLVEVGGGQPLDPNDIRLQSESVLRFLAAVGTLPGAPAPLPRYTIVTGYRIVTNARGGFFEAAVGPGARIREGEALGSIRAITGEIVETIKAPAGADIVLGVSTYPAAATGGWVIEVGTGLKEMP